MIQLDIRSRSRTKNPTPTPPKTSDSLRLRNPGGERTFAKHAALSWKFRKLRISWKFKTLFVYAKANVL